MTPHQAAQTPPALRRRESCPSFIVMPWDERTRRRRTTLLVGVNQLCLYVASLGPRETEDLAGGYQHPSEPGVMCIPISNGTVALIDAEDYPLVRAYPWHSSHHHAVASHSFGGEVYQLWMHRVILMLGDEDERVGDHINRNALDNRKRNLRACTPQQNHLNRSCCSSSTGIKGVYQTQWSANKWRACVTLRGVDHYRVFDSKEQAAAWVRAKRDELHGEFACHD